jgi:flagellar protein FliL
MADEEVAQNLPADQGGQQAKGNPIVAILLLINAVAMGFIGFSQYQIIEAEKKKPSIQEVVKAERLKAEKEDANVSDDITEKEKGNEGKLLSLDNFTANLAQGDGPRRYIRLNAVLRFNKGAQKEEFEARKPQIRDTVISLLNTKRPEDLLKKEGKEYLKEEIKDSVNSFLIDGKVVDVYYVSFQIN